MLFAKIVEGGEEVHVTCPRCYRADGNEGAMYISTQTGAYICFRCGYKGFLNQMEKEDLDFVENLIYRHVEFDVKDLIPSSNFDDYISGKRVPLIEERELYRIQISEPVSQRYFEIMGSLTFLDKKEYLPNFLRTAIHLRVLNKFKDVEVSYIVSEKIFHNVYDLVADFIFPVFYYNRQGIFFLGNNGGQIYFFLRDRKPVYLTVRKKKGILVIPSMPNLDDLPNTVVTEGIWDAIAMKLLHRNENIFAVAGLGFVNLVSIALDYGDYGLTIIPDPDKDEEIKSRGLSRYLHPKYFEIRTEYSRGNKVDLWDLYVDNVYKEIMSKGEGNNV